MTFADDEIMRSRRAGSRSLRRGAGSLNPEAQARAAWYSDLQKRVFKNGKEEQDEVCDDMNSSNKFDGAIFQAKLQTNVATGQDEDVSAAAVVNVLKPKEEFTNFLLDLGKESAARQEAEEVASKQKTGLKKPLEEKYTKPLDFDAKKWVVGLSTDDFLVRSRLVLFPGIGIGATAFRRWAYALKSFGVYLYCVQLPGRGYPELSQFHPKL